MFFYRLALTLATPGVAGMLALRLLRGRERLGDLAERLGMGAGAAPAAAKTIWLHGASNGELTSARDFIDALFRQAPDLALLVTTNSVTGRDMVRGWNLPNLQARLAPLDYRACLAAVLHGHRPAAFVLLEGDIWPNRMAMAASREVPAAMLSARISEKSARAWHRFNGLARQALAPVRLLSAQDAGSEARFVALGLDPATLAPQLTFKAAVTLPPPDAELLETYRPFFPRSETLLAASTHEGEEQQVIEAFQRARRVRPDLRLILAPRHPARGPEVASLLARSGVRFRTRSAGEAPVAGTDVYLADTLGEMPLWYTLAGQCFVGGSLAPKGGHTPYEPAQFDCAILHGPDLRNFAEPYAALTEARGAIGAADAGALGDAIAGLDDAARSRMTVAARAALQLDTEAQVDDLSRRVLALASGHGEPARLH
ncbi:3-deoxy-D-manno-octulosonic acid transferase [Tropicimonas marinistellae]|uniref:3-deoxy-D-manno-octulosonic acid transferase n=1 Tax=Tropicimonas marinistellae TaxID=1739787 RepID=UPI0008372170|nr:glycosyltransferase N-terminal domain-containing protein [Tropicimonas marinistellae]